MRTKVLFVFFILFLFILLTADTNIPAGNVSGIWNAAGSPYNIQGTIQVIAGSQLIIEPGVVVNFTGHYKFNILGTILAQGDEDDFITFTASNMVTGWHGLRFSNTTTTGQDQSALEYCLFEYGRATGISPDYQGGALYCINSSELVIQYSSFHDNSAATGGAIYLQNSHIELDYVEITGNSASGAGGGVYLNGSDAEFSNVVITGNTSVYDGGGVNCFNSDPVFTRSLLAGNSTIWSGGAISVFNNSNPQFISVTISDNLANQDGSAIACMFASSVSVLNSIIWDNAYNGIYVEPGTSFSATYSDIEYGPGHNWFGTGCIALNPLFTNPYIGDYSLSWANVPTPDETMSPCIDTGDPNSTLDPDGTIADMGAIYFAQNGIQGTVTLDGGNGNVTNVVITATLTVPPGTAYTTSPNSTGNYLISLPSGTYDLLAVLDGYSDYSYDNLVVSDALVTINIPLIPPPPGEIVGQVTVEGIGSPTSVLISAGGYTTYPYAVWDINHNYILYYEYTLSINPGIYTVTASMAGYITQIEEGIIVQSGLQTGGIDFYVPLMHNEGYITGTLTLVNGTGIVEDAIISAGGITVSPDDTGFYEIALLNGAYDVTASLTGFSSITRTDIAVTAFQTTPNIDFDLIGGWEQIDGTQYSMVTYATVTYDGDFMPGGGNYQIAAFGWDDSGTIEECRGTGTWLPGNHSFWTCPWDIDGFWFFTLVGDDNSGTELIWFDFYNPETGEIADCNEMILFEDGSFDYGVNLTIDSPITSVSYDLNEGWNWVSFNRNPADSSIPVLFDDLTLVPDVLQIKNQTGFTQYDDTSDIWVGALNYISYNSGYKINMLNDYDNFTFAGEKYNSILYPLNILEGWNWLSYLPEQPLPIAEALQSLSISDSTCIKTQNASAVFFGTWFGDLEVMEPGKAYLFNWPNEITDPVFLFYPPQSYYARAVQTTQSNLAEWHLMPGTETNMILMSELRRQGIKITDSSIYSAGVFDENGKCHSIGKMQNDLWYFTIMGNTSELLSLRIFDSITGETYNSEQSLLYEANGLSGNPAEPVLFTFSEGIDTPENISSFLLKANYPNPFNPATQFAYAIPQEGKVLLQIFNAKGQLITTLLDASQAAGDHVISWDATDQSSGIYFYKLQFEDQISIRKCILMK
ncbi:MAG: carboxypeptidase regulatory-like domain-containing protein [Candidatus Cloacimonetes bacterium]|nr:carboxypeptidase regulatory-like domain-containing protein [Candidatus Cloacimonadota bacterium]